MPMSSTVTGPAAAPWRIGPSGRNALLKWFLNADLGTDESIRRLRELTGRAGLAFGGPGDIVWLPDPNAELRREFTAAGHRVIVGTIPPGHEQGRHIVRGAASRKRFLAFYRSIQKALHSVEAQHHKFLKSDPGSDPGSQLGAQFAILAPFLDDARLGPAYRTQPWPTRRLEATIAVVDRPLRPEHIALSLIGELALAIFHRLMNARSSIVCRYCGRIELFEDVRRRFLCGGEECRARYRREWKRVHPENPDQVARRVRKHRARKGETHGTKRSR